MINLSQTTIRTAALAALCVAVPTGSLPAQLIPRIAPQATAATPSGRWTGTASERTELGEVSFPIQMQFSGNPDQLRVLVTGRGKVDVGQGQQLTFEVEADYRGAFKGGQLQMNSGKIMTRILETNEVIPSNPQVLTATLKHGELKGRVGSQEEGWTMFTARAVGAGGPASNAPASFAGSWSGDVEEPGPDGNLMRYGMRATVRELPNGSFEAQLAADLQYPTAQGPVPVQYRATFAGQRRDQKVELQSRQVTYRVVPQNRTENGPAQRITARLRGAELIFTLYSEGNQPTEMVLRRQGGAPAPRVEDPTRRHEEVIEEIRELPRHGGEARGGEAFVEEIEGQPVRNDGLRRPAPTSGTLVLEPKKVFDQGLGNVHSHTLMVPKDWTFNGGVSWSMNPDKFAVFSGSMRGPSGEEVVFGRGVAMKWATFNGKPTNGAVQYPQDEVLRPLPQAFGEIAKEVLLPRLRPGATNVQLVSAGNLPEVEQQCRTVYGDLLKMLQQSIESMRSNINGLRCDANMRLVAERARLRYTLNGQQWEEEFRSTSLAQMHTTQNEFMGTQNSLCGVFDVRSMRAPAGQLEAQLPTMISLAASVRETPRWSTAITQMRNAIAQARAAGRAAALRQAQANAARTAANDLSDMQMDSWRRRQDSIDRMHKATVDSISETQDFRSSDGTTYTFTNTYDRAFMNAGGQVVLTNDPSLNPAADPRFGGVNWQPMQRIDPFRR